MKQFISAILITVIPLTGCASPDGKPYRLPPLTRCSDFTISPQMEYLWPSNDAGTDDNGDGVLSVAEHLSSFDIHQIVSSLSNSAPGDSFEWTNPSTCNRIITQAGEFYEDENRGLLYKQACRVVRIDVLDRDKVYIGYNQVVACRHFTTHQWQIY